MGTAVERRQASRAVCCVSIWRRSRGRKEDSRSRLPRLLPPPAQQASRPRSSRPPSWATVQTRSRSQHEGGARRRKTRPRKTGLRSGFGGRRVRLPRRRDLLPHLSQLRHRHVSVHLERSRSRLASPTHRCSLPLSRPARTLPKTMPARKTTAFPSLLRLTRAHRRPRLPRRPSLNLRLRRQRPNLRLRRLASRLN